MKTIDQTLLLLHQKKTLTEKGAELLANQIMDLHDEERTGKIEAEFEKFYKERKKA